MKNNLTVEKINIHHNGGTSPIFKCSHAKTMVQRLKGLLGSVELKNGEGMLIEPCNSVHTFGMAYGIDIVYIDRNGTVIKCVHNMLPRRVSIARRAKSTLELLSGAIRQNGIKTGDHLSW